MQPLPLNGSEPRFPKTLTYTQIIHLSHVIEPQMPLWPGDSPVMFETVADIGEAGYYLRGFSMGEHSGTHMNAPNSFYTQGTSIDAYPAESLVSGAVVLDVRSQINVSSDYQLAIADILLWEEQQGQIPADSVVLLYTGWQAKWQNPTAFLGQDAAGEMHFPGFGAEAIEFLLSDRQIRGVGIDTHGVDSGQDTDFSINRRVLTRPRIVLENLTNLDRLPPIGTTLMIGILRLKNGSGSPAAVIALVP